MTGTRRTRAAATAAFKVLTALVPAQQGTLQPLYDASLAAIPAGRAKDGGVKVGEIAAAAMLAARTNDGRFGTYRFPAPATSTDPWAAGQWRPVLPAFGNDPAAWGRPSVHSSSTTPAASGATARPPWAASATRVSSKRSSRSAR